MDEKESIPSEAGPETRLQKSVRVARPWMLVALVAFGLGALLIAVAFYFPNRQMLNTANADLEHANATISDMTDQVATLQAENETLQQNLDSATLHMVVLEALSGVRGASLAVNAGDYAGARLSLIQASEALDTLPGRLGTDQSDVLAAMQQGAAQALTEIQSNLTSAPPELDLLTKNLVQLEKNLFPNP